MLILSLCLWLLAAAVVTPEGFRTEVIVREGEAERRWTVRFGSGRIRVEPVEGKRGFLLDVDSPEVVILEHEERSYCRMAPEVFRAFTEQGTIGSSWFPWAYPVAPDLVEELALQPATKAPLPGGGWGFHRMVRSRRYERTVAEYWVDPSVPKELFFQWRDVYFFFWKADDKAAEEAQARRLELYDELEGVPVRMEERFALLTRPRTVILDSWELLQEQELWLPEDYEEVDPTGFYWKGLMRRFMEWLTPEPPPPEETKPMSAARLAIARAPSDTAKRRKLAGPPRIQ